jgi:hypothetical protein
MRTTVLAAGLLTVAMSGRVSAATISTCGQVANGHAELAGDLDCSAFDGTAVTISKGTLFLHGFTLTGHAGRAVVHCDKGCKISGPGTITGGGKAVEGGSPVRVYDMTITGNTLAVTGTNVRVLRSSITANGSPNMDPLYALSGGVHGSHRVVVTQSSIQNNLNFGVATATAVVGRGCTIVNNGDNPDCTAGAFALSLGCADLAVSHWRRPPVVVEGSVCGRSQRLYEPIGRTWGACTND